MAITTPKGEQIQFVSAKTGTHNLDTYLEAAEVGNRQLHDLLDDMFDASTGVFKADNFQFRFDTSTDKIQVRVGQFANSTASWTDLTTFFKPTGTFSTSTSYNNFDLVTLSTKDVYIVHGLTTATAYSSESNFISSANTEKLVDVSEARDWATKTSGTVDGSDFSAKYWATTGNVAAVSGAISSINTVAGISANVTSVAGVASDVSTVAGISSAVSTVAADGSDIGTVAGISSAVSTVSSNNANVSTVAGAVSNIGTVAGAVTNVNTVAGSVTNVDTTAGSISNVNTVAGDISNVNSLAGVLTGSTTFTVTVANVGGQNVFVVDGVNNPVLALVRGNTYVFNQSDGTNSNHPIAFKDASGNAYTTGVTSSGTAGSSGATVTFAVASDAPSSLRYYCTVHGNAMGNTVSASSNNLTVVAGSIGNVNNTGGSISNVNTVGGSIANVNTVATNISSVNDFADKYRIGSSDPSSNNDEGDLFYNTATNVLKVYTGSSWEQGVTAGSGFLNLTGGQLTGNITFSGAQTVDGRDLSADGSKLDAIEPSATADQTAAEIRTLVESASDSNVFTDADHTKLDGVASSANNYAHPNHSGEISSTADGATVIADNIVDEANLKVSNAPTNGYVLTAQSGNTGGLTWAELSGDPTRGTLTKSFTSGETASITLSAAVSPAPVVSATKEVPQAGISSKGAWDVSSTGTNYDRLNSAYNTTLTPSVEGWDVSTSVYSQAKDISGQETRPRGVFFKPDGLKMYIVGSDGDAVNEYNLSTAWDVSTSVYSQAKDLSGQESEPQGIFFKPDGLKMYIVGTGGEDVNEYNLSTAWDVSTSVYSQNFGVAGQEGAVSDVFFKPDGTKMYIVGYSDDEVNEYNLSTAWDISTAAHSQNFSVANQDSVPTGLFFKPSGTKMYILGYNGDDVNEYNLSTAWDISTSVYSQNFPVSGQEIYPGGMFFKPDGLKMYIVGFAGDDVNEYNLSASNNVLTLGTGSFASGDIGKTIEGNGGVAVLAAADGSYVATTAFTDSSTIAAGSWSMNSVAINATNGLEMSGDSFDTWAISTSVYSQDFSVQTQSDEPHGVFFKPDGTKMYIADNNNNDIDEYNLSTAWDISTAVYSQSDNTTGNYGSAPVDLFFKPDGLKMYVVDDATNSVFEFNLSTAWDIGTSAYYDSYNVGGNETSPESVFFKPDGTKMYVIGRNGQDVNEYNLSTAWSVSTSSYLQRYRVDLSGQGDEYSPTGLFFKSDGLKMYVVGDFNNKIFEYNLSTAWDVSTSSLYAELDISGQEMWSQGMFFRDDGAKMYLVGTYNKKVYEYNVGTAAFSTGYVPSVTNSGGQIDSQFWTDINSMTTDEIAGAGAVHYAVSTDNHTTWSVIKNGTGVRPIVRNNSGTWQYNTAATTAYYDIANATYTGNNSSFSGQSSTAYGLTISDNGSHIYISGTSNEIRQYTMSTPHDVSTATYSHNHFSVGNQIVSQGAIKISPNGTYMFALDYYSNADSVVQYQLSTPYDISTASVFADTNINSQVSEARGVALKSDGTKIYVLCATNNRIYQYTMGSAYNATSLTYDNKNFLFSSETTSARDVCFNSTGTKVFIAAYTPDKIFEYDLSTAWDISTAQYNSVSYDFSAEDGTCGGFDFSSDGGNFYLAGTVNDKFFQYNSTSSAYTTSTTWANSTTNSELYALQQALTDVSVNRMDKTQLEAVTDANHYTLGNSLDLMISLNLASASSNVPSSDGVSINYDAASLIQGAVLGNDYNYDFPNSTTVRITSNSTQNLKIRVV